MIPSHLNLRVGGILILLMSGLVFYVVARNSGYGYDALEYLVIGRSLVDGYRFYDFIPSKSWGLYSLVALLLRLGLPLGHLSLSAVVGALFCANVLVVWAVGRRVFNARTAAIAAVITALCSLFMEMNYLEPESLVAITGLLAFGAVIRGLDTPRAAPWYVAGIWIGIGSWFKSVALFYLVGVAVFLLVHEGRTGIGRAIRRGLLAVGGVLLALAVPIVWFTAQGRLAAHIEWTYVFPLFNRPADLTFMPKLFTKLLWFFAMLLLALVLSARRRRIYAEPAAVLALCVGLTSLIALFKQQASHYVFPGAVLLSLFMARTADASLPERFGKREPAITASAGSLAVLLIVSAWLYRPSALRLLTGVRNFGQEQSIAEYIQRHVTPGQRALFFKHSTLLYWVSHRYPNLPAVKFDVQETWWLERNPESLVAALTDPALALVEFDPAWPGIPDRAFAVRPEGRALMTEIHGELKARFEVGAESTAPYVFWTRKTGKEGEP